VASNGITRRSALAFAAAAAAIVKLPGLGWASAPDGGGTPAGGLAAAPVAALDPAAVSTLEAFADTIVPGAKRGPDDVSIAGATTGPGAVQAGAIDLLVMPEAAIVGALPQLVAGLNAYATGYAAGHGIALDPALPPFVGLGFVDRTALVEQLTAMTNPDRSNWTTLALLVSLAFDQASQLPIRTALANHHAGLTTLGFPAPNADGLWRFSRFSYGRPLARLHPDTTPKGSLA
jgi:hypothetical protein